MATNDGYAPYPSEKTAEQVVYAIDRAYNLDSEFSGYVKRTINPSLPTSGQNGDVYTDNDKMYRLWKEGANLLWIEE